MTTTKVSRKQALIQIREKLATPDSWCQGQFAMDSDGDATPVSGGYACRFCLSGAAQRVILYEGYFDLRIRSPLCEEVENFIHKAARDRGYRGMVDFNDNSTHEEVLAFLDELIAAEND